MKDEAKDQLSTCGWMRIKLSSKASSITSSFLRSFRSPQWFWKPKYATFFQSGPRLATLLFAVQHLRRSYSQMITAADLFLDPCMLVLCIFLVISTLFRSTFLARAFKLPNLFFFLFSLLYFNGKKIPNPISDLGWPWYKEEQSSSFFSLTPLTSPSRQKIPNSSSLMQGVNPDSSSCLQTLAHVVSCWLKTRRLQHPLFLQHSCFLCCCLCVSVR